MVQRITHHDGILTWNEPSPQQEVENKFCNFKNISHRNKCAHMGVYRLELAMDPGQLTSCTSILVQDRRGEPSSAKFEIHMYPGIFFWRQAAL